MAPSTPSRRPASAAKNIGAAQSDFNLLDHGSVVVPLPRSPAALEGRAEHPSEGAMEWAGGVAIRRRSAPDILERIAEDALTVAA